MCSILKACLNCFVRQSDSRVPKGHKKKGWKQNTRTKQNVIIKGLHFLENKWRKNQTFITVFFLQLRIEKDWISPWYLKTYCYAAHYIYTLLADGYKFDKDNWNQISFTEMVGFHSQSAVSHRLKIWSVEMKKQKQKNAFIWTWTRTGPPAPSRFGWTIICYQRVAIRRGISGMLREHWASLTMGCPQQKGIPRLWLTRSHKICERLTKSHTLMLAFSNCMATNAQTFLSFWPKLTFEFGQQGSSVCACVCLRLWRGRPLYTACSLHVVAKQFPIIITSPDTQHVWAHVPHTTRHFAQNN